MNRRKRYIRIAVELAVLLLVYLAAHHAMAHFRVTEVILSPGENSEKPLVALAVVFMLLRFFIVLLAPGWVAARLYMAALAPAGEKPRGSAT